MPLIDFTTEINYAKKFAVNPQRKAKFKNLILKLPLGAQLLQLRRKIIARQQKNDTRKKIWQLIDKSKFHNQEFFYERSVKHLKIFQRYSQLHPENSTVLEIGTGVYLAAPIGLSLFFKKVIAVDVRRATPIKVQLMFEYYRKFQKELGISKLPKIKEEITEKNLDKILFKYFNIDYRAPYDAAHTDLPDCSVDYIFSQFTFEHIHAELLPEIVQEAFRILRKGKIFYLEIDFKDHRAYKNFVLTIYDYLQYTSIGWQKLENLCSNQFHQNRLRSVDFLAVFTAVGFEIVDFRCYGKVTNADRAAFAMVKVADEFKQKYTDEELLEKGGIFILRKP
ncbi:MAG: class I SAM-dependent methyltransferase [Prevotella sp.]|nr:class I SAM-dependent methyltransferase [Prevotella sp.]